MAVDAVSPYSQKYIQLHEKYQHCYRESLLWAQNGHKTKAHIQNHCEDQMLDFILILFLFVSSL